MNSNCSGLLLVDKPRGISSFDIIRVLRKQTGIKKFGHAGTLDPEATGLMLILVGAATKRAGSLSALDKTYIAEMTLGQTSSSGDAEGEKTVISNVMPESTEIQAALEHFTGHIIQVPPQYSAIRVNGIRAYKLARAGKTIVMPPRQVTILENKLLSYNYPMATIECVVSSGTYIRSLVQDIGERLTTGAFTSKLRRTTVGEYEVTDAHELALITDRTVEEYLHPIT